MKKSRENKYKSFLSADPKYLKKVKTLISEKEPIEEIQFDLLNRMLEALSISENPYKLVTSDLRYTSDIKKICDSSFIKLSKSKSDGEMPEKINLLWDYLAESDKLEKSDLIFVFGGQGNDRVIQAIDLYKNNFAQKILFTGKKASYMSGVDISEAENYAQIAEKSAVPKSSIILEKEAINTPENAVFSVRILKNIGFLPKSIILINHNFQMRRSYLTFKSVADWNPKLIRHAVAAEKYTRDNYYKSPEGWNFVFYEYIKLYSGRLMKHF